MRIFEHIRDVLHGRRPVGRPGWLADQPDARDEDFSSHFWEGTHSGGTDLSTREPPMMDQGRVGSCVPCAIAAMAHMAASGGPWSALFLYYDARLAMGRADEDVGVPIREAIKSMARTGLCPEDRWPYKPGRFAWRPPKACYEAAKSTRIGQYYRLRSLNDAMTCLDHGFPFVAGMTIYDEFQKAGRTGILPPPAPGSRPQGGHAVLVVGYDDSKSAFRCRNSMGESWGDKGHFVAGYDLIMGTQSGRNDAWTLRMP
jgi:hypothetical protein